MAEARWRGIAATLAGALLRKFTKSDRSWVATTALVLVNLLPLTAVLWRGWQPGDVLVVYWLENIAIGFWACLRLHTARGPERPSVIRDRAGGHARPSVPLFVALYGFFTFVQGGLVGAVGQGPLLWYLWLADKLTGADFTMSLGENSSVLAHSPGGYLGMLLIYLFSQGLAFRGDWLKRGERDKLGRVDVFDFTLGRMLVLHFTLIGGFFLFGATGSELAWACLLIALKIALEVTLYYFSRRRRARS
ncbi:hypothetical protein FPZ12_033925 [Amycolatopsis acidicola]|uniref:Uncharacterized protein n=1 Tax=Amycolatopsis acidicola TaxID=2596893 RepID=A0A5N0UU83_9PSEU|nr:DUF6498-containing protein [Amycolatopsis acidicola]KAA9153711.1 hypothetical protein FPZ12_033925 [Amycolatopsis acidicola]